MKVARSRLAVAAIGLAGLAPLVLTAPAEAKVRHFSNCDAMHRVYPHGVGLKHAHDHTSGTPVRNFARKPAVYRANTGLDRDKDHIACESA